VLLGALDVSYIMGTVGVLLPRTSGCTREGMKVGVLNSHRAVLQVSQPAVYGQLCIALFSSLDSGQLPITASSPVAHATGKRRA
jgi:hypothetical protein